MAPQNPESMTPKASAPKDKNCQFCGQAFTSSSLGRHLDLYIKEKNPKPPDGIHDVEIIKRLRGGITRRHPRGSIGHKDSTPTGTPRTSKQDLSIQEAETVSSISRSNTYLDDSKTNKLTLGPRWEATGVMNDIPSKQLWEADAGSDPTKRPAIQRSASKQIAHKVQFDVKKKLADAMDTARAAELALRELLASWRAAKQQIANGSMPFSFDPLSLDFPALTLQCLQPPPTLFSSTQHPTSTSWSVQPPGQREFGALQAHFQEEFRAWKITCAAATTATVEDLTYPPSSNFQRDPRDAVKKAEKTAENLETLVEEHLQSAYVVWDSLPAQRRQELWILELARGVGRRQKEAKTMDEVHHRLKQENANLKMQIDQLNRLQQPREFKLLSPTTIPVDRDVISYAYEQGVKGGKSVGFDMEDRHVDISTVVSKSIERWKSVITSTRANSGGMSSQRPLDQGVHLPNSANLSPLLPQTQTMSQTSQQQQDQMANPHNKISDERQSTASANERISEQTTSSNSTTGPPSVEEEEAEEEDMSDQDADAEMEDDDSFAIMNTSPMKTSHIPMQQSVTLDVPRTRGLVHQQGGTPDMRFMMQTGGASALGRSGMPNMRSMPNMNLAMQGTHLQGDLSMMQQVRGDSMYME